MYAATSKLILRIDFFRHMWSLWCLCVRISFPLPCACVYLFLKKEANLMKIVVLHRVNKKNKKTWS